MNQKQKLFSRISTPQYLGLLAAFCLPNLTGCASINSVSLTPIPAGRAHVVKAEATKTVFLAFNFDNDFVDTIVADLRSQCPKGVVSGILTKDETTAYVIIFKRTVTATGFCSSGIAKRDSTGRTGRSTASEAGDAVDADPTAPN